MHIRRYLPALSLIFAVACPSPAEIEDDTSTPEGEGDFSAAEIAAGDYALVQVYDGPFLMPEADLPFATVTIDLDAGEVVTVVDGGEEQVLTMVGEITIVEMCQTATSAAEVERIDLAGTLTIPYGDLVDPFLTGECYEGLLPFNEIMLHDNADTDRFRLRLVPTSQIDLWCEWGTTDPTIHPLCQ